MNINELINGLVKDLRPVRPLRPFGFRMAAWTSAAAAAVGALLLAIGARRDFDLMFHSGRLMVDAGAVALIAVTASWGALRMSVPGDERMWTHRYLPMGLLAFWIFFSVVQVIAAAIRSGMGALMPDPHLICALLVLGAGGLLTFPIGVLIRSAAPLDSVWCGALAGLAAGAAAMVGIEFLCIYERPAHIAVYHVLPVSLFTAAGAAMGRRLFKMR